MALFERIHEVALPLLNLFNYQAGKKKKLQVLKSRNIKSSRLVCHVMWVYLVLFLSHPCWDSFLSHYVFPYPLKS